MIDLDCHYSAYALGNYWLKRAQSSVSKVSIFTPNIMRKNFRKQVGKTCFRCGRSDLDKDVTLKQCGKCEFFFYCGKECQLSHWKELNHIGECKQLQVLKEYHRPYAKQIHEAIICGEDPRNIPELQTLWTKLGLNRPKEEYEELILLLGDNDYDNDDDGCPSSYKHLVATRKGTVHIGSTPEAI